MSENFSSSVNRTNLKKVGDILLKGALDLVPGGGILGDFLALRGEQVREFAQRRNAERIEAFHRRLLHAEDGSLDQEILKCTVEEGDFLALLQTCVADIETEKTDHYAEMMRSIATGRVPRNIRRHFILALRDLSAAELHRMQCAYVVSKHEVIPELGPISRPDDFLGGKPGGTLDGLEIAHIAAHGFTQQNRLSSTGMQFVEACFTPTQLLPAAIGKESWSPCRITVISYEIGGSSLMMRWIDQTERVLLGYKVRSSCLALSTYGARTPPVMFSHAAILLVGAMGQPIKENTPALQQFGKKRPLVAIVLPGGDRNAIHGLALAGTVDALAREPSDAVEEALEQIAGVLGATQQAHAHEKSSA